ncbi:outer membrane autotransporter protein [Bartonella callosciuri]|uniref:Outer membrane autotransporter protein n=1 Tax=Bartonella callosciuri TaxID=686223 RepID=A0A840NQZ0_9HYPH|nr:autotransporter outer membrane beta-barrel domain-containing protein [Bartonella callosciuri]MBB5073944.1 outer membrane autotransporter protein [Bartonella callosciuri]
MIKVFRNHVCLCAFTTALLSLLQNGVGGCATAQEGANSYGISGSSVHNNGLPYSITVTSMSPNGPSPSIPSISSIRVSRQSGDGDYNSFEIVSPYNSSGRSGISDSSYGSNIPEIVVTPLVSTIPINGNGYGSIGGYPIPDVDGYPINYTNSFISGGARESGSAYAHEVYEYNKLILHDGLYYMCDGCTIGHVIDNRSYEIKDKNIPLNPVAITVKGAGTKVSGKNVTVGSKVYGETFLFGVSVSENGKVVLEDLVLKNADIALHASYGTIELKKGIVEESQRGVDAIGDSLVILEDTNVKTRNGKASLLSYDGAEVRMKGGSIDFMNSHAVSSTLDGKVNLDYVRITGKSSKNKDHAVFLMDVGGSVDFKGTIDVTDVHGILSENTVDTFNSIPLSKKLSKRDRVTEVNIESSSVTVKGDGSYGIYFRGEKPLTEYRHKEGALGEEKTPLRTEAVNIRKTMFSVPDSVAIYSTGTTLGVVNLMQTNLSGSSLLRAEKGALVKVLASTSTLEGDAYVDDASTAEIYLGAGSTWIVKQNQQRELHESGLIDNSSISLVYLADDSSINFKKRKSASTYDYQTLRIGKGTGEVYKAQNGAHIYLNTYLNEGGELKNQKTDRVLIHGDVSGETTVHVHGTSGSPGGTTGSGGNNQGISIIQISGEADVNSFQLEGGYTTLEHSPYQYKLYAYGPKSDLGKADSSQRLVAGNGEFWDFRLENRYMKPKPEPKPDEPGPQPDPEIKAVVPQVPTYLLLPNALFHTDLMNITNQSKRLEILRIASGEGEMRESPALFIHGYGGSHRYLSNLSAAQYGYGGELDYNTFEVGVLLQTIENAYGTASFGVTGTYQRLSLQPLDVEQSQKSAFDKWTATAYGTIQHDEGFYVDGLFSYGLFNGDVSTLARGKTATLKGNPLSASLASGKVFVLGETGLILDPQVQVVYQRLQFNKASDVDDFNIEMGKLDQWIARVGGRLTKTFTATDEARVVSFYGKLHLNHGFGKKQFVHFKDAFQLGDFGSSLETGLGFNAQLSQKFALYGDLVYQHKLTKAGFSGASFSGGLRYHF